MAKILIVYYSKSGHTEKLATEMALQCGADLEAVHPSNHGDKGFRFLSALFATGSQRGSAIDAMTKKPDDYDVVVVGTPVWMFKMSSFTREYLTLNADQIKKIAFFCTEGGSGDDKVFQQMTATAHQQPVATLVVTEDEFERNNYIEKLVRFVNELQAAQASV